MTAAEHEDPSVRPDVAAGPTASLEPVAPHPAQLDSLHPDCPDRRRLGPTVADARLRAAAVAQQGTVLERGRLWGTKFSRRKLLAGGLGVGVAALGSQLVTTRVSYADPASSEGTLVVIFLRGGLDGLSVLVPAEDPDLISLRPQIAVRGGSLIPLDRGFGLHPSLAPLKPLISAGRLAVVPAVSTPDLSRSHFQAQDCLERGGATTSMTTGWLDRVLSASGPGTTFRSVAVGGLLPRSLAGPSNSLAMRDLASVKITGWEGVAPQTHAALETLYTGLDHPISTQALLALDAVTVAAKIGGDKPTVTYPDGAFAHSLQSVAALIKGKTGLRVACLDVGGWDMHTGIGTVEGGDMKDHLADFAAAMAAFTSDIGGYLDTTTIVTMSEFGRRVEQNASGGTDHGHGGVVLAMGGGVKSGVQGKWQGLGADVLDSGDVPGTNDYRDVLSEVVMKRLGLSAAAMGDVFTGWTPTSVGVMA